MAQLLCKVISFTDKMHQGIFALTLLCKQIIQNRRTTEFDMGGDGAESSSLDYRPFSAEE